MEDRLEPPRRPGDPELGGTPRPELQPDHPLTALPPSLELRSQGRPDRDSSGGPPLQSWGPGKGPLSRGAARSPSRLEGRGVGRSAGPTGLCGVPAGSALRRPRCAARRKRHTSLSSGVRRRRSGALPGRHRRRAETEAPAAHGHRARAGRGRSGGGPRGRRGPRGACGRGAAPAAARRRPGFRGAAVAFHGPGRARPAGCHAALCARGLWRGPRLPWPLLSSAAPQPPVSDSSGGMGSPAPISPQPRAALSGCRATFAPYTFNPERLRVYSGPGAHLAPATPGRDGSGVQA